MLISYCYNRSIYIIKNILIKGHFKNPYGPIKNIKSELSFDVSDTKGFVEAPKFKIGNEAFKIVDDNNYKKH